MCLTCIDDAGVQCTCLLADNTEEEVALDNFTPNPVDTKKTTSKKTQKRVVKNGAEQVKKQDQAMWSALTGMTATKKCVLAVTLCAGVFQGAIGHSTSFFDPE